MKRTGRVRVPGPRGWLALGLMGGVLLLGLVGLWRAWSATPSPSPSRTPTPTELPRPHPDRARVTPLPSPGLTPTLTDTPTATPTPTPTATPSPTPSPVLSLADAWWLQAYDEITRLAAARLATAAPEKRPALLYLLALAAWLDHRPAEALARLDALAREGSLPPPLQADALFLRGKLLARLDQPEQAIAAYQAYVRLEKAPLKAQAYYALARLLRDQERRAEAEAAYRRAIALASGLTRYRWTREFAAYLADGGQVDAALALYRDVATTAPSADEQAQAWLALGRLLFTVGRDREGVQALREVLEIAVGTRGGARAARVQRTAIPFAYEALRTLLARGARVDAYTRGVIDVEAGAWQPAITVLIRYLDTVEPHHGDAHAYLARALAQVGNVAGAVEQWETLIATHPECTCWTEAWFQLARLYRRQGQPAQARAVLLRLARAPRASPIARERAQLEATHILLNLGNEQAAADAYVALALRATHPDVRNRAALSAAVLTHDRQPEAGLRAVQHALGQNPPPVWADPLRYWEGRLLWALGRQEEALTVWRGLAARRPFSFYAFRAAERLQALGIQVSAWAMPANPRPAAERPRSPLPGLAIAAWLARHPVPPDVAEILREAAAWADVGDFPAADRRFRQALARLTDPETLEDLGETLVALGWPHLGIQAASHAVQRRAERAPTSLRTWCLLYPTPAFDYVRSLAREYNVDIALLYALMRQESHFVPWATSPAQARGIMQLIPDTARYVARVLGLQVADEDVYRPRVNLRLGTFYLADALRRFNGAVVPALIAYNAGPGNAARWQARWGDNPDVLLERVPYLETRTYLREVQRQAAIYRTLLQCGRGTCRPLWRCSG